MIELWTGNYKSIMSDEEHAKHPWVISFCGDGGGKFTFAVLLVNNKRD